MYSIYQTTTRNNMNKILNVTLLALFISNGVQANDNEKVPSPSIENNTSSNVQNALNSQVTDIPTNLLPEKSEDAKYVESHSLIGFLQGQLRLTPEQIEQTKNIFNKHYQQSKEEFYKILTPEQKERLYFLESQDVKNSFSL